MPHSVNLLGIRTVGMYRNFSSLLLIFISLDGLFLLELYRYCTQISILSCQLIMSCLVSNNFKGIDRKP